MTADRNTVGKEQYTLCSACGKTFAGTRAFDDHRVGSYEPLERYCLSTFEMERAGCTQNARGDWSRRTLTLAEAGLA